MKYFSIQNFLIKGFLVTAVKKLLPSRLKSTMETPEQSGNNVPSVKTPE